MHFWALFSQNCLSIQRLFFQNCRVISYNFAFTSWNYKKRCSCQNCTFKWSCCYNIFVFCAKIRFYIYIKIKSIFKHEVEFAAQSMMVQSQQKSSSVLHFNLYCVTEWFMMRNKESQNPNIFSCYLHHDSFSRYPVYRTQSSAHNTSF